MIVNHSTGNRVLTKTINFTDKDTVYLYALLDHGYYDVEINSYETNIDSDTGSLEYQFTHREIDKGESMNDPVLITFGNNYSIDWYGLSGISNYNKITLQEKSEVDINLSTRLEGLSQIHLEIINGTGNTVEVKNINPTKLEDTFSLSTLLDSGTYYIKIMIDPTNYKYSYSSLSYQIDVSDIEIGETIDYPLEVEFDKDYSIQFNSYTNVVYYNKVILDKESLIETGISVNGIAPVSLQEVFMDDTGKIIDSIDITLNNISKTNYKYITLNPGTYYIKFISNESYNKQITLNYKFKCKNQQTGDTFDNPIDVEYNKNYSREWFGHYGDTFYNKIVFDKKNGKIKLNYNNSLLANFTVSLLDENGTEIDKRYSSKYDIDSFLYLKPSVLGTYYIKFEVESKDVVMPSIEYNYEEISYGGSIDEFVDVTFGYTYTHEWETYIDVDYYNRVIVEEKGILEMYFDQPHDSSSTWKYGYLDITVLDDNGDTVYKNDMYKTLNSSREKYYMFVELNPGTYYVNIKPIYDEFKKPVWVSSYRFNFEPNAPVIINPNYTHTYNITNRKGLFNKVEIFNKGILEMQFNKPISSNGSYEKLQITIYDKNANVVYANGTAKASLTESSNYNLHVGLDKGVYYVVVKPRFEVYNETSINYVFRYISTDNKYVDYEPNNTKKDASTIQLNNLYRGYIGSDGCDVSVGFKCFTEDYYKIDLEKGKKYVIYTPTSNVYNNIITPSGTSKSFYSTNGYYTYYASETGTYYYVISSNNEQSEYEIGFFHYDINDAKITGIEDKYYGDLIKQNISISINGEILKDNIDYNLSYENYNNLGSATVTIRCISDGKCDGQIEKSFEILPKDINELDIEGIQNMLYTGEPVVLPITIKRMSPNETWNYLCESIGYNSHGYCDTIDYTVEYIPNNINVGVVFVKIKGIGNYTGEILRAFNIAKINIDSVTVLGMQNKLYDGTKTTQSLKLIYEGKELVENVDYTLTFKDNINAGTARTIIRGIGKFTGSVTKRYTIYPRKVGSVEFTGLKDVEYTGRKTSLDLTFTYNGVVLKEGIDYNIIFKDNINVGTARIIVRGIGNYSGELKKAYRVIPKKTTINNINSRTGGFSITWTKQDVQSDGYVIEYSDNNQFTGTKKSLVGVSSTAKSFSGLTKGKTYYVRMRVYKDIDGVRYFSQYSNTKYVIIK